MHHRKWHAIALILFTSVVFGQEESSAITPQTTQFLTYQPSFPEPGSFSVIQNDNDLALSEQILLEINKHRLSHTPVLWTVQEGLVLLLQPFAVDSDPGNGSISNANGHE